MELLIEYHSLERMEEIIHDHDLDKISLLR